MNLAQVQTTVQAQVAAVAETLGYAISAPNSAVAEPASDGVQIYLFMDPGSVVGQTIGAQKQRTQGNAFVYLKVASETGTELANSLTGSFQQSISNRIVDGIHFTDPVPPGAASEQGVYTVKITIPFEYDWSEVAA